MGISRMLCNCNKYNLRSYALQQSLNCYHQKEPELLVPGTSFQELKGYFSPFRSAFPPWSKGMDTPCRRLAKVGPTVALVGSVCPAHRHQSDPSQQRSLSLVVQLGNQCTRRVMEMTKQANDEVKRTRIEGSCHFIGTYQSANIFSTIQKRPPLFNFTIFVKGSLS